MQGAGWVPWEMCAIFVMASSLVASVVYCAQQRSVLGNLPSVLSSRREAWQAVGMIKPQRGLCGSLDLRIHTTVAGGPDCSAHMLPDLVSSFLTGFPEAKHSWLLYTWLCQHVLLTAPVPVLRSVFQESTTPKVGFLGLGELWMTSSFQANVRGCGSQPPGDKPFM